MPETEADRMLRKRREERERKEEEDRLMGIEAGKRIKAQRQADYRPSFIHEIRKILQLAPPNYPFIEEFKIHEPAGPLDKLFGYKVDGVGSYRRRHYTKAGWMLTYWEKTYHPNPNTTFDPIQRGTSVILLSEGSILTQTSSSSQFSYPFEGELPNLSFDELDEVLVALCLLSDKIAEEKK